MVYILFKILFFFLHAALRRRWFKRFRINFPFRTPSKHTRRQWQKTGKWTREQNGLYSAHTDPARNKVKRTIYINYQNIHITETKASVCLSFKRLQWCMSFKADMWYIGYCAKGKKKKKSSTSQWVFLMCNIQIKTVTTWWLEASPVFSKSNKSKQPAHVITTAI